MFTSMSSNVYFTFISRAKNNYYELIRLISCIINYFTCFSNIKWYVDLTKNPYSLIYLPLFLHYLTKLSDFKLVAVRCCYVGLVLPAQKAIRLLQATELLLCKN